MNAGRCLNPKCDCIGVKAISEIVALSLEVGRFAVAMKRRYGTEATRVALAAAAKDLP